MTQAQVPARSSGLSLRHIDRYLLVLRWATIGAALLLTPFSGAPLGSFVAPFGAVIAVNLALSVYAALRRPFMAAAPVPLLVVDAVQAAGVTIVAGGAHSPFFPLFLLLVVELAVAFPARVAAAWIPTAGALHVAAVVLSQQGNWSVLAGYMAVGKLLVLLIVGALGIVFTEQLRHEERDRETAERHALQLNTLNELFFELNQPAADLTAALQALLRGARRLLQSDVGMMFLCDPALGCWRVTASLDRYETLAGETRLEQWGWQIDAQETFTAGPAYALPLPPGWPDARSQAVAGIRVATPAGDDPGAIVVGRAAGAFEPSEWLILRALAREAELSLRNAQLHAQEHAQVLELQRFEDARRSFFSAVAHELRTPLTVLKTLLPSLGDWPRLAPDQQREVREMVDQNLERLEGMITEILEASQVEAGAVTLHRGPVDLAERLERAAASLRPLFESRRQSVSLALEPGVGPVDGDRRRLDQVISSLLHNAYKWGPLGSVIRGTVAADGDQVRLCIEDGGPGVPAGSRERIFDKFYSVSGQTNQQGVGLGLYICRELVALHGGRIWYEARPGGGSRFCLTIPAWRERSRGESDDPGPGH